MPDRTHFLNARVDRTRALLPGILVSGLVAIAAQFVSEHYGAPAMLMALLFGMALHFLSEPESAAAPGIAFSAREILKFGIVLLGARISVDLVRDIGWPHFVLVVLAMFATVMFGLALGRLLGKTAAFSVLTGGATAICGASAALAISSVLPKTETSDEELSFTVLAVTLLSTLAMVFYPILATSLHLSDTKAGAFLGATIHDVAQVIGAGFVISDVAGESATLVKLTRVTLLAPIVILIAFAFRRRASGVTREGAAATPWLPAFVIGFLIVAALNSAGLISAPVKDAFSTGSRIALLMAISAVGLKSSLRKFASFGGMAVALVIGETVFLAVFVLAGLAIIA